MKRFFAIAIVSAMLLRLHGATITIGDFVANPGAWFTVPVEIDSVKGMASAVVRIAYDPEVLELKAVRQGDLKRFFDFDFTVEMLPAGVEIISVARDDIAQDEGGTLAELRFAVREGSGGLYSEVTFGDVHLDERTMTLDLTARSPLSIIPGKSRSLSAGADCTARIGRKPLTVVGGSILNDLTLTENDLLGVSDDHEPVVVNGTLTAPGTIRLATPDQGWMVGSYDILRTSATGLRFSPVEPPEGYSIFSARSRGITTYVLSVRKVAGVPVESVSGETITETDKNRIRSLFEGIAGSGKDAKPIHVSGTADDIRLGLDLGLMPDYGTTRSSVSALGSEKILATFGTPRLRILSFTPSPLPDANGNRTGVVRVKVIPPAEGGRIVSNDITEGTLTVVGSDDLSLPMEPVPITAQDIGSYLDTATKGEVTITLQLGKNRFVRVRAGQ